MKYTILDYLEETASRFPDKTAFADVQNSITWSELVAESKKLSAYISANFEPGCAVPVMIDKSVRTIKYFFAALYSGCFYSYFDATFPESRLGSMIETLEVKKIIADKRFEKKLSNLNVEPLFFADIELSVENNQLDYSDCRRSSIIDTDPVYANFTSGSTGTPKAVVISHRSVIDFISCFTEIFGIDSTDNIGNQAPFDFDVSVKDIFSGVFTGATVHLIPKMFFSFPTKLIDFLEERQITNLTWAVSALCIISTLNGFDYKIPSEIKRVMFSGEVMPCKQLEIWMKNIPDAMYVNLYGPTEITCNCTYYIIPKGTCPSIIPIGIPFPNERIILLDENNQPVTQANQEGELCVSGTCVGIGYYNSPKTTEVFVQNPVQSSKFERIYKTGDLAKYGDDGLLYYIGRKDTQIKHMGHRIELGEIEGAIAKIDSISRACCIFQNNKISAFYTGSEVDKKDIVSMLKNDLPVYMIPGDFIFIDEFPLTKNGKIDKKILAEKIN